MTVREAYNSNPALIGSPRMCAIFEALAGIPEKERFVSPSIGPISITSDGFAVSGNQFLGDWQEIEDDINGLCNHFEDMGYAAVLLANVTDWRSGGNAWG